MPKTRTKCTLKGQVNAKNRAFSTASAAAHSQLVTPPHLHHANPRPQRQSACRINTVQRHLAQVIKAAEVEAHHDNQVAQDQDAALEVIALTFAVHVRQQEDAQDYGDHVPLREDECY